MQSMFDTVETENQLSLAQGLCTRFAHSTFEKIRI